MQTVRLFVAIEMPGQVIQEAIKIQNKLGERALFKGKFTSPEQLHITLKFIGAVPEGQVEVITNALKTISLAKQEALLGELDVFTRGRFISIILLHVICPELVRLAGKLNEVLVPWCQPENRPFVSHLTIARVKHVEDQQTLLQFINSYTVESLPFTIDAFVLKQSELTPEGPVYTDIMRYELD